jgi:hypothetical protein
MRTCFFDILFGRNNVSLFNSKKTAKSLLFSEVTLDGELRGGASDTKGNSLNSFK